MMKKIGFLLGIFVLFAGCKSVYRLEPVTPKIIDELTQAGERGKVIVRTSLAEKVNKAAMPDDTDDRLYIQRLQYYISATVIFEWNNANQSEERLVIPGDSYGILINPPEKQDDKYVLTLKFDNIILEFKEADNGFFYLTTPMIHYDGYTYVRDTESVCKLQYRFREENMLYTVSRNTWSKRIEN